MFVGVNSDLSSLRKINSTFGVSKLMSFDTPKPLQAQLISGLMMRCDKNSILCFGKNISNGDNVEILSRLFTNFIATVDNIEPQQRIWVLLEFMGIKTRIGINADQLQLAK